MKKNTILLLLLAAFAFLGGCAQHQENPNVLLGKDSNPKNLRELTTLRNQHYSQIHSDLTREQLKEVETLLGKPVKEKAITYYHLTKKRSKGLHGIYFAVTNADMEVLVFLQGERIQRIKIINHGRQGVSGENILINRLIGYSLKDFEILTTYKDYRNSSPEIKSLINKIMVSMAFLKVKDLN